MNVLSVLLFLLPIYAVLFIPVGIFNLKVFRATQGTKCAGLNLLKAFTPICNITFARKLAYGQSYCYNAILCLCAVLFLFRLSAVALVSKFPVLIVYSAGGMLLCLALYWLLYIINCVDFCRMFDGSSLILLFGICIPPVGYYMLSTQVLNYFRSVEDTVSGRFGD